MSKDECGHPTQAGGECQHPTTDDGDPERCWIPSHNDADADNPDGRPSKYNRDRADDAIEAARNGYSKAGCARAAGVAKSTLQDWLEKNPGYDDGKFRNAFRRARHEGEQQLVEGPLRNRPDDPDRTTIDGQHARFLLSTSFDYQKTEKKELEDVTEGDGGFGTTIVLDSEYVED